MKDQSEIRTLTKTFDDLPIGVGVFHVEDFNDLTSIRYVFINKVLLLEMRKEKEEVIDKTIFEVAPEAFEHESGLLVMETYRKIAEEGGSINLGLVEYSNHMVAGTYECSVHHIELGYVYVMLRNVTELEQTKNKLEQKNKELKEMAYIVSHDLQEPLRTISSFVDIIKEEFYTQAEPETAEMFDFITGSTARMNNLILDLLDYNSIGKKRVKDLVDCEHLIEIVKLDMKALIDDTNVEIKLESLPKVHGFRTELGLLFQNLISNSIKFRKPDGALKLELSATQNESGWTFKVKDNGIGIKEEDKEKIFKVFERLHGREQYEGTGIGLAHCKKIVELHNGKIWVDSNFGEGSAFNFTIPHQAVKHGVPIELQN